ncbi:MAG: putative PEP-CTERM system TPR-repeat lipoprotein [Halioglobus sp.]|jgi:putative PEP-CTERM system TPR-repeat lipoprotein
MNLFLRILTVLLLGISLIACEDEVTSEEHLATAKVFQDLGNARAAIVELKNALQKDVNNSRARSMLGKIYYDMGEYESAVKELSRAYERGVDSTIIVPVLAQSYLSLGEFRKLEDLRLDGLDPEGRSLVQAAKGLSMLYQNDMNSASESMTAAMANDPRSPYAEVASARLAMAEQDYEGARIQLTAIFEKHPDYAPAWNLLGDVEAAQKDPRKAHEAYTNALEIAPKTFDARLNRAMMRIYMKNFGGARKDVEFIKNNFGKVAKVHPGVLFANGLILLQNKFIDQARKQFEQASEFSDAYPLTYYYMAAIDLENGLVQQSLSNAYRFLGFVPNSIVGAKLAARLELEEKNYEKVEELLRRVVLASGGDTEALNLLASALLAQGKNEEGVALLARVAYFRPDSSQAQARLGAGYFAIGDEELGMSTLKKILDKDPQYEQADILIVLNFLRQGKVDKAIESAKEYGDRNPESTLSFNLLGRAYVAAGDQAEAEKAFTKSLELQPGDPGANHAMADFATAEKDYEAARGFYHNVLDDNPAHMETLMKVAGSYALEGNEEQMFVSLDNTLRENPRAMEPRIVKARFFIARGDLEKAGPLLDELSEEQKATPDALLTTAGFELAANRYNQARTTLEILIKLRPEVSQYYYMRAKAHAGLGNLEDFTADLNRAVELDPNHFYAKIALARLAYLNSQPAVFDKRLAELKEMAPDNPDVMKLEVVAAQKRGDNALATKLLDTLVRQSPTTSNVVALASHRDSLGNTDGAITLLNSWLEQHADDIKAREKLASFYSKTGQVDSVVEQYNIILKDDEHNVVALNNLAWYLLDTEPEEALKYAERVYALSPGSSSVLDTLAMALMNNDKLPEARRIITRALDLTPKNPDIRYHSAKLQAAEGDNAGAIEALTELLQTRPEFAERAEAESLLRQLTKS